MAYLDTPRTDAGNHTYLSDAHNFPIDNSFVSPLKRKDDLILQMRNHHGLSLRTPRARQPLTDSRNIPQAQAEFTPLLKSAVRANRLRKDKVINQTPSFAHSDTESPLSRMINSSKYDSDYQNSFAREASDSASVPQIPSSSAQSTPLAMPSKDSNGVLLEQGNKFTLKEQENMLDKIEKENFGLKLKIHFFEKMLQSADSGFDEAAVKENMDLKVDKVTIQRELARTRKTLVAAEREIEGYRVQVQQAQEKAKKRLSDETLQRELDRLQRDLEAALKENDELRSSIGSAEEQRQTNLNLQEELENLEAELRERDRILDSKEDEIDDLKEQMSQDLHKVADLEEDLKSTKQELKEVQKTRDNSKDLSNRLKESEDRAAATMERIEATLLEKQKAEDGLHELQMQVANNSNVKGINQQLEETTRQLQAELDQLHTVNASVYKARDHKAQSVQILEENLKDLKQQIEAKNQSFRESSKSLERERDCAFERESTLKVQLQKALENEKKQYEAKNLLQHRHDALTDDLQQLQKESLKYRTQRADAEDICDRRQQLLVNDQALGSKAKEELGSITSELHELRERLQGVQHEASANEDKWTTEKRDLELQRDRFETRVHDLQDVVERLKESEGAISSHQVKMQEAIAMEKQRFKHERAVLNSHIQQLREDLNEKGHALENSRSQLASAQEKLTTSEQGRAFCEEKIQGLEDEIEVLQCSLEECNDALRDSQVTANNHEHQLYDSKRTTERQVESDVALERSISKIRDDLKDVQHEKAALARQFAQAQSQLNAYNKLHDSEKYEPFTDELELRTQVIKLQRKLMEAGENTTKLRAEFREREATYEQKILALEDVSRSRLASHEQNQKQLELNLSEVHRQLCRSKSENEAQAEKMENLRRERKALETSQSNTRASKVDEIAIAEERKDLHVLLKKAKLEAEDLQIQLQERKADLQRATSEGNSLRQQLSRVQEDCTQQKHQVTALFLELESLQRRYEISIESLGTKQKEWEEERRASVSKGRVLNTSIGNIPASEDSLLQSVQAEKQKAEKRHIAEIRGLTKQIHWMKARQNREERFRAGLIFEKRYLLLQVEMFNACNALDLRLLEGMGVASEGKPAKTKPTMKIVAIMVLAGLRMQRLQRHWTGQKKVQASLAKRIVQMRRSKVTSNQ